jgi:mono/diheme cytochrome c family protein
MCGQCHTPRDGSGNSERSRWLAGAPVAWLPAKPESDWPINAPQIGGTPPPASDADMIKLLTTGVWTTGSPVRPSTPPFRMNREDADSVIVHLKSLGPHP